MKINSKRQFILDPFDDVVLLAAILNYLKEVDPASSKLLAVQSLFDEAVDFWLKVDEPEEDYRKLHENIGKMIEALPDSDEDEEPT